MALVYYMGLGYVSNRLRPSALDRKRSSVISEQLGQGWRGKENASRKHRTGAYHTTTASHLWRPAVRLVTQSCPLNHRANHERRRTRKSN